MDIRGHQRALQRLVEDYQVGRYTNQEFRSLVEGDVHPYAAENLSDDKPRVHVETRTNDQDRETVGHQPIAVIGMAGFFPGADSLDDFCCSLERQESLFTEAPRNHFADKTVQERRGAFIDDISTFDPELFNISAAEAEYLDPRQRLLLMSVWHTLEDACYLPARLDASRVDVYIAAEGAPYVPFLLQAEISPYAPIGMLAWSLANRISHTFKFSGKSLAIDTACSGSMVALQQAMESLRKNEAAYALVGAANLLFGDALRFSFHGQESLGIVGQIASCHPFQNEAKGFLPAECVMTVLLKKLSHAKRDHDHIHAVLLGAHVNHAGGYGAMTMPSADAQSDAMVTAYRDAGIDPGTVTYIEAHAASTVLADAEEIKAFKLGEKKLKRYFKSGESPPCAISTIKPNMGHANCASGLLSLLRVIHSFKIEKKLGIKNFVGYSDKIDLEKTRFYMTNETETWKRMTRTDGSDIPRRAAINNFGAGGVNAHLLVEEYRAHEPEPSPDTPEEKKVFFLPLSATHEEQLVAYAASLYHFLEERASRIHPDQLEYIYATSRSSLRHRVALRYKTLNELREKLKHYAESQGTKGYYFKGSSNHDKGSMEVFKKYQSLSDFLQTLTDDKDKSLLFDLWAHGIDQPVRHFFASRSRVAHPLPRYPFRMTSFWVKPSGRGRPLPDGSGKGEEDIPEEPGRPPATERRSIGKGMTSASREALLPSMLSYLKKMLAAQIQSPAEEIDEDAPLERYGIDSVFIQHMNAELENTFGTLPKTLFFECQTLRELGDCLVKDHAEQAASVWGLECRDGVRVADKSISESRFQAVHTPRSNEMNVASCPARLLHTERQNEEPIAVIGLSGRYPQAPDVDQYWNNLRKGKDCVTEIPESRWDYRGYYDPDPEQAKYGKMYCKWGGFLDGIEKFDPLFFNISPREAAAMDPQERIFLETVWAAMEDAGYTRACFKGAGDKRANTSVGVFVGVTTNSYDLLGAEEWLKGNPVMPMAAPWSIANRVSYTLNLKGPSMPVDTACSSSLVAVHLACESLRKGECEFAFAGGVNLYLHPSKFVGMCQIKMLSSRGRCHAFGVLGDGFVPGEGVGVLLLKPLRKAERDGDHVYGLVLGTAVNHGGKTNGYTVPNPLAQQEVIRTALERSQVDARAISYVEAHGTGTSLGDPIEIAGLTKAFESDTHDRKYCAIASVKSNIGHLESAAGVAGVTKILLQMKHKKLAPSLHMEDVNPGIDFDNTPFKPQRSLGEWRQPNMIVDGARVVLPRRAGISSFGAGGMNAHIVLEEYRDKRPLGQAATPARSHMILVSAKTKEQVNAYARRLLAFLEEEERNTNQTERITLADIAYTLQVGRDAMESRWAVIVKTKKELTAQLTAFANGEADHNGAYHGDVRSLRERARFFAENDETIHHVTSLFEKEKWNELAEFWVQGGEIDWTDLYKNPSARRVSLPTYPFAEKEYWLPQTDTEFGRPISSGREGGDVVLNQNAETNVRGGPRVFGQGEDLKERRCEKIIQDLQGGTLTIADAERLIRSI